MHAACSSRGKVLITYTGACTKKRHKQEARGPIRAMDSPSTKSRVALTPAELAPDVQQHDESDEQQAQHEDRCRATAQREPQPLRMGVAEPGVASRTRPLTLAQPMARLTPPLRHRRRSQGTRIGQVTARAATAARTSSGRERRPCRSGGCQRRRHSLKACCPLFSEPDPCAREHRRSPGARPSLPAAW